MGYIDDNPERWARKKQPTVEEIEQIGKLIDRFPKSRRLVCFCVRFSCILLRCRYATLQTSEEWITNFNNALLEPQFRGERRSIARLNAFSERRSGLALLCLYLFAQHGRIQFLSSVPESLDTDSAHSDNELEGNYHNVDHLLLGAMGRLCKVAEGPKKTKDSEASKKESAASDKTAEPEELEEAEPSKETGEQDCEPQISSVLPFTMARWASVADYAGGYAPRTPDRIHKIWKATAARPSQVFFARSCARFRESLTLALASKPTILLFGAACLYLLYLFMTHVHNYLSALRH